MFRIMKSIHLFSIGTGFLASVAWVFNLVFFLLLFPRISQFQVLDPSWENLGIVAGLNIIILAIFHLSCVLILLTYLIVHKKYSFINISAIVIGIISGIMIMADLTMLSEIGKEYTLGWQTQGEWMILFISYGTHIAALALGLISLIRNLERGIEPSDMIIKDEVLFLSLISTGVISGWLGLLGVFSGIISKAPLQLMEQIVPVLGLIILTPFLVILLIWILRGILSGVKTGLDEKQYHDLAVSGLISLIITLPVMIVFFGFQISPGTDGNLSVLWLPLLVFLALAVFSSLVMRYFREYR